MAFEQAYYTSCEVGLRGSKGFQMNAASQGLSPVVLTYLERMGVYIPPLSCPTMPTEEQLRDFPKALSYYRLPDGAVALSRSKYIGKDYSGRYGNYFTHFIVSQDARALIGQVSPVLTWEADFWDETNPSGSTQLTPLRRLENTRGLTDKHLHQLISPTSRALQVTAFLTGVQGALHTGKRVIMADENDEAIARWIALAAAGLPTCLLEEFTFTTYTKNPYNLDVLICGTTTDSDFAFSATELQHQYLVFDFVKQRFSPALPPTAFAETIGQWCREGQFEWVAAFKAFADSLPTTFRANELDALTFVFLMHARKEPLSSFQDTLNGVQLIIDKSIQGERSIFDIATGALGALGEATESLGVADPHTKAQLDHLAHRLFATTASQAGISPEIREDVIHFFVDWTLGMLPQATGQTFESVLRIYREHPIDQRYWEAKVGRLHAWIEQSDNLTWLSAMFDFAQSINLLYHLEEAFSTVVVEVLLPNIAAQQAQAFLEKVVVAGFSSSIDQLVLGQFKGLIQSHQHLQIVEALLHRQPMRDHLARLAWNNEDAATVVVIEAFNARHASDKSAAVRGFLTAAQRQRHVAFTRENYNTFFLLCWGDSSTRSIKAIPADEARLLIEKHRQVVFQSDAVLEGIIRGLLLAPDIFQARSNATQVLSQLAKHNVTPPKAVAEDFNTAKTLATWPQRFKQQTAFKFKLDLVEKALLLLPNDNVGARQDVVGWMLPKVLASQKPHNVKRGLAVLYKQEAPLLMSTLQHVIPELFSKNIETFVVGWQQLFRFLQAQQETDMRAQALYDEDLARVYAAFSKETKLMLDEAFEGSGLEDRWHQWAKSQSRSGKLKRLVLSSLGLYK